MDTHPIRGIWVSPRRDVAVVQLGTTKTEFTAALKKHIGTPPPWEAAMFMEEDAEEPHLTVWHASTSCGTLPLNLLAMQMTHLVLNHRLVIPHHGPVIYTGSAGDGTPMSLHEHDLTELLKLANMITGGDAINGHN